MDSLSFKKNSERLKQIDFHEIELLIGSGLAGMPPVDFVVFYLNAKLGIMTLNNSGDNKNTRYKTSVILHKPLWSPEGKRILLVDDVFVSGKTMNASHEQSKGYNEKTHDKKGSADFVLFSEINDFVKWPCKE